MAGLAGHMVGFVAGATDGRGQLRTAFEAGTTDGVGWFDLEEIELLPHVEAPADLGRGGGLASANVAPR